MPRKPVPIRPFREKPDARRSLTAELNLGPKSSAWLLGIGIKSLKQVQELGPIEVCRRLHVSGRPVSVLMAYALEGAVMGCHWNAIPWETKQFLRAEFARMKRPPAREWRSDGMGRPLTNRSIPTSFNGMETVTISPKFQVVIPQSIREAMGIRSGEKAHVIPYRNRIEIIPVRDVRKLRGSLKGIDTSFERAGDRV